MWKWVVGASAVIVVLALGALAWFWQDMENSLRTPLALSAPLTLTVESGMTIGLIGERLAVQGILETPHYLEIEARRNGVSRRIKRGEYEITPGMNPRQLLAKIVAGEVIEYSITFIEGWRFRDIREALAGNPNLDRMLTGVSDEQVMERLGEPQRHPEGLFFPDTYRFRAETSDLQVLRRARRRMQIMLSKRWQERVDGLPYESPYDALIMASIIEKETGLAAERADISGVFVRRLRARMRLQSDPTVIYGMGDEFDGNIRRGDLQTNTAYNTYVHRGLPPTPIAMPGDGAINAALNPAAGSAFYFVAKGDGSHHFSSSIEEHNRAVRQYQKRR